MKKIIRIVISVTVLFAIVFLTAPIIFKKKIMTAVENSISKELNADIGYERYKLSLLRDFPDATVELRDLQITKHEESGNDTLLGTRLARGKINILSLIKSDIQVKEILFVKPEINWDVKGHKGKKHNHNTNHSTEDSPAKKQKTKNKINWVLDKLKIQDADFNYLDTFKHVQAHLSDVNINISGKMFGDSTQLKTQCSITDVTLLVNGSKYISETKFSLTSSINANLKEMRFAIAENELLINQLPLEISGNIALPGDTIFPDIRIKTKTADFDNFLALIPPVYKTHLEKINTSGKATINTEIKGFLHKEEYPAINIKMEVNEGCLKFADKPQEIKNIKINALINKPQGSLDLTKITVENAHAEINDAPVDFGLKITQPASSPYFDVFLNGKLNLADLKNSLPVEKVNLSGTIDADLSAKGSYADVENGTYENIKLDGTVVVKSLVYDSQNLSKKILIPKGKLVFSPKNISLNPFFVKIGQSDFQLSGKISNHLNYIFQKKKLNGNIFLKSNFVNINELIRLNVKEKEKTKDRTKKEDKKTEEKTLLAFDIPENINITFNTDIKKAVIGRTKISSVKGKITAQNKKLCLENLNMNLLGGSMKTNGSYKNTTVNRPLVDLNLDVNNFDFPTMCHAFSGLQKIFPGKHNKTGKLSANLELKGQLTPQLKFIPESRNGKGTLSTKNININNSKLFNKLDNILDKEKLKDIEVDDFTAYFTITDGNIELQPFSTKITGQAIRASGTLDAQNMLNARLDFNVERKMFGADIRKMLKLIPGNEKIKRLPAGVNLKGTLEEPKINMDLSSTQKAVTDATKDDIKKSLNKLGEGLKKLFK